VLQSGQGAAFPATGNFRILIGTEIIIVGARSGDTLSSLTRGAESTVAAAHNAGDAVTHELTAGALSTFATLPLAISSISGYPSDATKFPSGGGTWISATPAMSTTLPGSPINDQQAVLVDSTTLPTFAWLLQYNATAAKWIFIGGTPLQARIDTSEGTTSTTYAALATPGPTVTVPRAGDYNIKSGALISLSTGAGITAYHSYDVGATGALDADAAQVGAAGASGNPQPGPISATASRKKTGLAASTTLTSKYRVSGAATGTFALRWIEVKPISIT
jgi:hypothetical protein